MQYLVTDVIMLILGYDMSKAWLINKQYHYFYEKYIRDIRSRLITGNDIDDGCIRYMQKILRKLNSLMIFRRTTTDELQSNEYYYSVGDSYELIMNSYDMPKIHRLVNYIDKLSFKDSFDLSIRLGFTYTFNVTDCLNRQACSKIWMHGITSCARSKWNHFEGGNKLRSNNNNIWLINFLQANHFISRSRVRITIKMFGRYNTDIDGVPVGFWTSYDVNDNRFNL